VIFNRDAELHATLVRYLLDQLSDEERNGVEEHLLADAELQERLAVAEEEIADRYVNGELLPELRKLVEQKFGGCPDWEGRTDVARAMAKIEAEMAANAGQPARSGPAKYWEWRFVLPLAGLLTVAVVVWFGLAQRQPTGSSPKNLPNPVASFLLTPAISKDASAQPENIVILPARAGPIELRLPLNKDFYPSYQVQLQSFSSEKAVSLGVATPLPQDHSKEIRVSVDSASLSPGRYTIVLRASETDGSVTDVAGYSFRVVIAN
jgi:hypothetical protein